MKCGFAATMTSSINTVSISKLKVSGDGRGVVIVVAVGDQASFGLF